ncbi:helix-turn-helix domain-containing protein [Flagellimonas profundi]|uniref:Helix-turn-helix transcriptional regulator n=1 Tax=Flagellimonas profundi TaxID=2915620 RepID=A0ABS3FE83_9FLAO|nr:helix-turn-helix transcriptional regulator [Allomuricauda profundi]MBO0340901.1 helix-turn-helix transcriptional regulator [Allomuricauda profundi]
MISLEVIGQKLRKISKKKLQFKPFLPTAKKSKIKIELILEISRKLGSWEEQKGFLNNKVTLHSLSETLHTNSTYLSKVINLHKNKNFSSYLKDIRITYAINHLKDNPDIVKTKSMIQIAEMYGFNSLSVFTKSFKNKTGVTPGVFFKQILEDEWRKSSQSKF